MITPSHRPAAMSRSMIWRRKSRPADELGERRSGIRLGDGAGREQPGRQRSRCSRDGCGQQPGGCMPRRRAPVHPGSGTGSANGATGSSGLGLGVARWFERSIFSGLLTRYLSQGIGPVLFGNSAVCLVIALANGSGGAILQLLSRSLLPKCLGRWRVNSAIVGSAESDRDGRGSEGRSRPAFGRYG